MPAAQVALTARSACHAPDSDGGDVRVHAQHNHARRNSGKVKPRDCGRLFVRAAFGIHGIWIVHGNWIARSGLWGAKARPAGHGTADWEMGTGFRRPGARAAASRSWV